eukprot:6783327-Lingulodinium_polyedra.AAC.1
MKNRLLRLDAAVAYVRHVTAPLCVQFARDVDLQLQAQQHGERLDEVEKETAHPVVADHRPLLWEPDGR